MEMLHGYDLGAQAFDGPGWQDPLAAAPSATQVVVAHLGSTQFVFCQAVGRHKCRNHLCRAQRFEGAVNGGNVECGKMTAGQPEDALRRQVAAVVAQLLNNDGALGGAPEALRVQSCEKRQVARHRSCDSLQLRLYAIEQAGQGASRA